MVFRTFKVSKFYGMEIVMFSGDPENWPRPFFNVDYGMRTGFVYLDEIEVSPKGFLPHGSKILKEWARARRKDLLENWERGRRGEKLKKIEPLL